MVGRRVKQSEIWGLVHSCNMYIGYLDLFVFKAILMSFGAVVSKWSGARKRLAVERNGVKFGTQG